MITAQHISQLLTPPIPFESWAIRIASCKIRITHMRTTSALNPVIDVVGRTLIRIQSRREARTPPVE